MFRFLLVISLKYIIRMEVFEQFRLVLILIMAFFSYVHISSIPALPPSDEEDEQVIEEERNQEPNADDEVMLIEIEEDVEHPETSSEHVPSAQDVQVKQETVLVSHKVILTEEVIDLV